MSTAQRTARIIRESVELLELDLRGLVVLTEAATGHYAATAAIALMAGVDTVFAVARNSSWGSAEDAASKTRAMAKLSGCPQNLVIVNEASADVVRAADIVTNLGAVRPISAGVVANMKDTAVVPLMCEPWEVRPADVDLDACLKRGIVVLGTNESTPAWPVFSYSGTLAIRMLFEAGLEVLGTRVAVLGRDHFAPVIAKALRKAGARVRIDQELDRSSSRTAIRGADAIVIADYATDDMIVGAEGLVRTQDLLDVAPDAVVIQFAGALDETNLVANGLTVWPNPVVPARRMSRTLSALGVKPVVQLHAAGLRVGEAASRLRRLGVSPAAVVETVTSELTLAVSPTPRNQGPKCG